MKEQQVKQFYTKLNKAIDKYQNLCIKQRTFSLAGCVIIKQDTSYMGIGVQYK